jgi:hypothetical protein
MNLRGHISSVGYKGCWKDVISGVTWHDDVTRGDVDPCSTCHVSPRFVIFMESMCPL